MKRFLRRRHRDIRFTVIVAVFAAAMAATLAAHAQQMTDGGTLVLTAPTIASAGVSTVSGGTFVLTHAIGTPSITAMTGGGYTLTPGVLGAVPAATPDFSFTHAFPTPFEPSKGQDRITFRGLPVKAVIKIYTVTGQLVNTFTKDDPFSADYVWKPVTNASGRNLASGVYYYQITGDNGRASGKIMVIR
jgi:hypothetical protein